MKEINIASLFMIFQLEIYTKYFESTDMPFDSDKAHQGHTSNAVPYTVIQ